MGVNPLAIMTKVKLKLSARRAAHELTGSIGSPASSAFTGLSCWLAHYFAGGLVLAQADEARMTEVIGRSPLDELDLRRQFRPEPAAFLHIGCGQTLAPTFSIEENHCGLGMTNSNLIFSTPRVTLSPAAPEIALPLLVLSQTIWC